MAKYIKYARVFLNRMLNLLRSNYANAKRIVIDNDFQRDLNWFNTFLPVFNGVSFFQYMLNLLRSNYANAKRIVIDNDFQRDLNWFNTFLPVFNGVSFFQYISSKTVQLDACPSGLGAIYDLQVYAMALPASSLDRNIALIEMINILVALIIWHSSWAGRKVLIKCDNQSVVSVLNNGMARYQTLAKYARNIFMRASACNINLTVVHVVGKQNPVADLLVR